MLESKYACDHCGKTQVVMDEGFINSNKAFIYMPKDWRRTGKNKHLCGECVKKLSGMVDFFMYGGKDSNIEGKDVRRGMMSKMMEKVFK